MTKILITGASGFIGHALVTYICRHISSLEVFAAVSGRRKVNFADDVKVVAINLLDPQAVESVINEVRPDIVLHLAWNLENGNYRNSRENIEWLESSLRLLRSFITCGGKRFIIAGSSAEYGFDSEICVESDNIMPADLYGECKLAFTKMAARACGDVGVEYASARIFSVYGPREKRQFQAVPMAIMTLMSNKPFVCKQPNNVWDFVYINDVALSLAKLAVSNFCGIVNIASGRPYRMREVFDEIANQMGRRDLLLYENENKQGRRLIADTRVLNETLGVICDTSFKEGIQKTLSWWNTQKLENGGGNSHSCSEGDSTIPSPYGWSVTLCSCFVFVFFSYATHK